MTWLSVLLRSIFGRPRFLVGRLGVDDSDAEVGDDGDSRFSMWGEREGDMSGCGASPLSDEGCDVVLVGEKLSGSFGWSCLVFIAKLNGYWPS
jgi:hypothetical protein